MRQQLKIARLPVLVRSMVVWLTLLTASVSLANGGASGRYLWKSVPAAQIKIGEKTPLAWNIFQTGQKKEANLVLVLFEPALHRARYQSAEVSVVRCYRRTCSPRAEIWKQLIMLARLDSLRIANGVRRVREPRYAATPEEWPYRRRAFGASLRGSSSENPSTILRRAQDDISLAPARSAVLSQARSAGSKGQDDG